MQNADHAFTRAELIEKALGYTYDGLDRTIDSHIKNLRKKIEADPAKPEYLETVFGIGYRLREG
jgi:two-component system alkaline phosphatase synthesis response regulator PhoP